MQEAIAEQAAKDKRPKENDSKGVMVGALVGAVVAGPIGSLVGASLGRDVARDVSYNRKNGDQPNLYSILADIERELNFARETLDFVTSRRDDEKKRAVGLNNEASGLYDLAKEIMTSGADEDDARKFLLRRQDVMKSMSESVNIVEKLSHEIKVTLSNIQKLEIKLLEARDIISREISAREATQTLTILPAQMGRELPMPPIDPDPLELKFRDLEGKK